MINKINIDGIEYPIGGSGNVAKLVVKYVVTSEDSDMGEIFIENVLLQRNKLYAIIYWINGLTTTDIFDTMQDRAQIAHITNTADYNEIPLDYNLDGEGDFGENVLYLSFSEIMEGDTIKIYELGGIE